jgi:hypothetical protein
MAVQPKQTLPEAQGRWLPKPPAASGLVEHGDVSRETVLPL